ncbi:hypothetical protein JD844_015318 [Phrynosoma platyrhinos]|uniref:Uncharacterized protein n=1 Tax=Phrynosoma platyrhinos TaxID=52577 RepID=A0ABQ7SIW5_PHRPL|nr:hypothetical protein JD844_015318 [Phrynosoma platyrhinos]
MYLAVCLLGEHIYAVAGRDNHGTVQEVERYEPRMNAWEYMAPLRKGVYAHAGAALKGKMYIACGRRGKSISQNCTTTTPPPTAGRTCRTALSTTPGTGWPL